jgi:hypothetical protein
MDTDDIADFLGRLSRVAWDMDYQTFCTKLGRDRPDRWTDEKWLAWKTMTNAIGQFDNATMAKLLGVESVPKFNKGDKVVCVDASDTHERKLVKGQSYTVEVCTPEWVVLREYPESRYMLDRFERWLVWGSPPVDVKRWNELLSLYCQRQLTAEEQSELEGIEKAQEQLQPREAPY